MGAVISLVLTVGALIAVAILDFMTASHADGCKKAQQYSILSGIVALLAAIIAFIITIVAG